MKIQIKYHDPEMPKLEYIGGDKSDWIDLRASETTELFANTFYKIYFGVSMILPNGFEAHIAPRGGMFKKYGLIQVNGVGVIDNSYSGTDDIWFAPMWSTKHNIILKYDRICQFRIMEKQPTITFEEKNILNSINRGGDGSTGVK